jgi:hypothetical protein
MDAAVDEATGNGSTDPMHCVSDARVGHRVRDMIDAHLPIMQQRSSDCAAAPIHLG